MAAFETQAQMNPGISSFQTILATVGTGRDLSNLVKMCALSYHIMLLLLKLLPDYLKTMIAALSFHLAAVSPRSARMN